MLLSRLPFNAIAPLIAHIDVVLSLTITASGNMGVAPEPSHSAVADAACLYAVPHGQRDIEPADVLGGSRTSFVGPLLRLLTAASTSSTVIARRPGSGMAPCGSPL